MNLKSSEKDLSDLHQKLSLILEEQSKNWKDFTYAKKDGFYQSLQEIKIQGARSTEKRFESYEIDELLSKNISVLDIGCNCAFFSIFITKFLKDVTGIDINPYMIKIGNATKDFLNIDNLELISSSFENFQTKKKFGINFDLNKVDANIGWILWNIFDDNDYY